MSDEGFQVAISRVLRIGVTLSAAFIVAGVIGSFLAGWEGSLIGAAPGIVAPTAFTQLRTGLLELRPIAITQLGLLLLIATPVTRVAVSVAGFARERDALYVAITLGVLAILLASLLLVR